MSLQFARAKLSMRLMMTDPETCSDQDIINYLQDIDDWFNWFQKWEMKDSFSEAFKQHRMTARVVARVATTTKNVTTNKLSMNHYNLDTHKLGSLKKDTTDVYNTTLAGMKLRLNPDNFGEEKITEAGFRKSEGKLKMFPKEVRGKYNLGLHDMSAVLLNTKRGTIFNQLAWKESVKEPDKYAVAFMPLPLEVDLQLFYVLNAKAKTFRGTKLGIIYEKVAWVRHRMTRVKLANETDAGSGFVNVGTGWKAKERKYKYGLGLVKIPEKTGAIGIQEAQRRTALALEYRSMLRLMPPMPEDTSKGGTNNEIVISYRSHASDYFPLFTVYNADNNCFVVIDGPEELEPSLIGTTIAN